MPAVGPAFFMRFKPLILLLLVAVTSCRQAVPARPPATRVVTDDLGRRVNVPLRPNRIISVSPEITEILFAVGAGDRVVAVVRGTDWPPAAKFLPVVGDFSNISLERVAQANPDLVFATGHEQERAVKQIERLGVPVVALMASDLAGVRRNILTVGELVGEEENARRVVKDFDERLKGINDRVAAIPAEKRRKVYLEISPEPLMTVARGSFVDEAIAFAGGVNVAAALPRPYCRIDAEEIIKANPDVIILCHSSTRPAEVAARPGWDVVEAVRHGRIYVADANLVVRAGPRLAEGIHLLHELIYSDE